MQIAITSVDGVPPSGNPAAPTPVPTNVTVVGTYDSDKLHPPLRVKCQIGNAQMELASTPSPWTINFTNLPVTTGPNTDLFASLFTLDGATKLAAVGPAFLKVTGPAVGDSTDEDCVGS